jgi:hypothetical protein
MTDQACEELEGTTLCVYAYVVKEGRPVGTREVMRGANLSSPSVAFRQLQKLETLGLLEKNQFGNYVVKEKASVSGHVWVGRSLVPRLMFYSFFFLGALGAEVALFIVSLVFIGLPIENSFIYLMAVTAAAAVLFLIEGISLLRKLKRNETGTRVETRRDGGETN